MFGLRPDTAWKFYAQIVSGVMADAGIDDLNTAAEKVVPRNEAYELA